MPFDPVAALVVADAQHKADIKQALLDVADYWEKNPEKYLMGRYFQYRDEDRVIGLLNGPLRDPRGGEIVAHCTYALITTIMPLPQGVVEDVILALGGSIKLCQTNNLGLNTMVHACREAAEAL